MLQLWEHSWTAWNLWRPISGALAAPVTLRRDRTWRPLKLRRERGGARKRVEKTQESTAEFEWAMVFLNSARILTRNGVSSSAVQVLVNLFGRLEAQLQWRRFNTFLSNSKLLPHEPDPYPTRTSAHLYFFIFPFCPWTSPSSEFLGSLF